MRTLQIRVSDELYFKLVELKGKWQADDWTKFMAKVIEHAETNCL